MPIDRQCTLQHLSPHFLLYGREPKLPPDVALLPPSELKLAFSDKRSEVIENIRLTQDLVKDLTQEANDKMKAYYDKTARPFSFDIGDKAWITNEYKRYNQTNQPNEYKKKGVSAKLQPKHVGPFRVIKKFEINNYTIKDDENKDTRKVIKTNLNRLRPYVDPTESTLRPDEMEEEIGVQDF